MFTRKLVLLALLVCASCAPSEEVTAVSAAPLFANPGFESGAAGQPPMSWTVLTDLNNGIVVATPETYADLNFVPGGNANTITLSAGGMGPGTQQDPALGAGATFRWPRYGQQCAIVNGPNAAAINTRGATHNVNELTQTMTIGANDVDPADTQVHIRFAMAPVRQNPTMHTPAQQAYYFVQVTNVTRGNALLYSDFNLSTSGGSWQTTTIGGIEYDWTDWTLVDVAPGAAVSQGDMVRIQVVAAGCAEGAHWAEVYLDGLGPVIPGLSVEGTGPAQANAGANVTYNLTYRNASPVVACSATSPCAPVTEACVGGVCAETNVVIDFTNPPNTTFATYTPPAGATCVPSPAAITGTSATLVCTFTSPVTPGLPLTFPVTVTANTGFVGPITASGYDIHSVQEPRLVGPGIRTMIGCNVDADCVSGQWCFEAMHQCRARLSNGTAMPIDPPHTAPALNGICTGTAASLACVSGVCDVRDNECGYANGDGPCTPGAAGNGGVVCRSGVCDVDGLCGYRNSDGPCTPASGPMVCRSGVCSVSDVCEAAGSCLVDGDCNASQWCNETTHVCTARLTNGIVLPNDPPHTSPILNGTCTSAAGAVVCASGVCDVTDNKCGYAINDGPCTAANGGVVCRTTACSTSGVCMPLGGCDVDADCAGGNWCMETTHTCRPKLANGMAIPTDGSHVDGTCSAATAMLVCVSGVCDLDNRCGMLNGDGPCTSATGATVCRSSVCDVDGLCGYANGDGPCSAASGPTVCRSTACSVSGVCEPLGGCDVDADCTGGNWCDESTHACTPTLPNGMPLPVDPPHANPTLDGTCNAGAGVLVCTSGVCDTSDGRCGYANGDGPCTSATGTTVCRSMACSANGSCEPAGGCNVDADCTGGWCNETTHACQPLIANGSTMPTDAAHTNPTLDGTCSAAAGALVCISGVCDPSDNRCGRANGDGPCTSANGASVCRSMVCGASGVCAQCIDRTTCSGSTPACDVASGTCVQCTSATDCASPTSACDPSSHLCVVPAVDAGTDAGRDAGVDGGSDAGVDGALNDAALVVLPDGAMSIDAAMSIDGAMPDAAHDASADAAHDGGSSRSDATAMQADAAGPPPANMGSCGCRATTNANAPSTLVVLALAIAARRRRRAK
jgi:MYXO-CTERM domain-containing protein